MTRAQTLNDAMGLTAWRAHRTLAEEAAQSARRPYEVDMSPQPPTVIKELFVQVSPAVFSRDQQRS